MDNEEFNKYVDVLFDRIVPKLPREPGCMVCGSMMYDPMRNCYGCGLAWQVMPD
jgi:hypothetical protein